MDFTRRSRRDSHREPNAGHDCQTTVDIHRRLDFHWMASIRRVSLSLAASHLVSFWRRNGAAALPRHLSFFVAVFPGYFLGIGDFSSGNKCTGTSRSNSAFHVVRSMPPAANLVVS